MKWQFSLLSMLALCASTAFAGDTYEFFYELRVPKNAKFDQSTQFYLVTDSGSSGTRMWGTKRRDDSGLVIFSDSWLVDNGEKRRAVIVSTDKQPSQIFRLKIPPRPKPADWTQWQRPDYVEKTDAWWTFMHDLKEHDRSTNVPPDSFELRFKIAEWKEP